MHVVDGRQSSSRDAVMSRHFMTARRRTTCTLVVRRAGHLSRNADVRPVTASVADFSSHCSPPSPACSLHYSGRQRPDQNTPQL